MSADPLFALDPLDGRYADAVAPLRRHFSEFALIRDRVGVEIAYLRSLARDAHLFSLTDAEDALLLQFIASYSPADAHRIRVIEAETRHDVKAVEYFLRERLRDTSLRDRLHWLHFGLTSEDVNQTALAFQLLEARDSVMLPALDELLTRLRDLAREHRALPMLARTHGQPAVATTLGKEYANYYARLSHQRARLAAHTFTAKLTGAVGNLNAHVAAAPQVDWLTFNSQFLAALGLRASYHNTQLMPYDNWIEYFDILRLTNTILLSFAQDLWRYISDDWLTQKPRPHEVGSSTMPHKLNPIDFENAEGNLGLANAQLEFFGNKLPISRLQRDLSDSTVRRTFGVAHGHTLLAWQSLGRGLDRIEPNHAALAAALDAHWEIISEGAQTILRAAGVPDAYEQLKQLTLGKPLTRNAYLVWVDTLPLPESIRDQLRALTPQTYLGLAPALTDKLLADSG